MIEIELQHTTTCTSPVTALASLTRTASLVVATEDGGVTLWTDNGTSRLVLLQHSAPVSAMHAFTVRDADYLAVGDAGGHVCLMGPLATTVQADSLLGRHVGPIRAIAGLRVGDDWLIASAGDDGMLRTRRALAAEDHVLTGRHAGKVAALCGIVASNDPLLVSASEDGHVFYWEPVNGRAVVEMVEVGRPLTALCTFMKRGAVWVAAGVDDGTISVWALDVPRNRVLLAGTNKSPIVGLAWLSDSAFPLLAALTADGALEVWSVSNESLVASVRLGDRGVAVVEPLGRASVAAAYDASWALMSLDLDLYVLDLESPGTGA